MKYDHTELYALLRSEPFASLQRTRLVLIIEECHNGRLRHPITQDNLHLFRRYRNSVSGDARRMLADADRADLA